MALGHPPSTAVQAVVHKLCNWSPPPNSLRTVLLLAFTVLHLAEVQARNFAAGSGRSESQSRSWDRRLTSLEAVALPASIGEGWTLGRAGFYGPPQAFTDNFISNPLGIAYGGDCGLFDGNDATNASADEVPPDMLAALATSHPDLPGSCGRCYELRCVNSVVPGNYSSANIPIPYALAADQLKPVYQIATTNSLPPVDSYNRSFPGNVLNATKQMFTQCWNASDAKGLLSPTGSITVRVTGSCPCHFGSTDNCCTNIPQFNLGYSGFEKLAHPDYGLLNLMYRPVSCYTNQMLPQVPGFINKTIYSEEVGAGWGVGGYQDAKELQAAGQGLSGSNATCFTLQKPGEQVFFFCRDCHQPGLQPFLLSNTSGLQFYIKPNGSQGGQAQVPQLALTLGYDNVTADKITYTQVCTSNVMDLSQLPASETRVMTDGYVKVTAALFQNHFQSCVPKLDQVTSFALQNPYSSSGGGASPVSFCLDEVSLLASSLQTSGLAVTVPKGHPNCIIAEPEPVDQNGTYLPGVQIESSQNLSDYTSIPFTDLQYHNDMTPSLGTCFVNGTASALGALMGQVNECASTHTFCCYATTADQESGLPNTLAQICNKMASNGNICQGFVYDSYTHTAFFKGTPPGSNLNTSSLCIHPNSAAWALKTALQNGPDQRAVASTVLQAAKPACNISSNPNYQDLQNLAARYALTADMAHNVSGNDSQAAYILYPHADLQGYLDLMPPSGSTCSVPGAANSSQVETCTASRKGVCCVDYSASPSALDGTLPDTLANICNNINITEPDGSSNICQGFVYDNMQKVAFFKGQANGKTLDASRLCSTPTGFAWLSSTALSGGTKVTDFPPGSSPGSPGSTPPNAGGNGDSGITGTAYGIIAGIVSVSVPVITWLAITYSYRMDKRMVVSEVVKHLQIADIALDSQPAVAHDPQHAGNVAAPALVPPSQARSLQRIRSASDRSSRQRSLGSNSTQSRNLLSPAHRESFQSSASDAVHNPLLLLSGASRNGTAGMQRTDSNIHDAVSSPSTEMKSVAKHITVRCLRRWDGILAFRAGSDGLGRRSGVWRDKFDGVRYGVLLLAMRKLNQALTSATPQPSSISEVWQRGDRPQRTLLLNQLVRTLQSISEEEAQALPDKDPERPGLYDKLCGMMTCCGH